MRAYLLFAAMLIALPTPTRAQQVPDDEASEIARDAYVYAYPLVLTHVTIQKLSNFAEPKEAISETA